MKTREDWRKSVRYGAHGLDEDIQSYADNILTRIADGVATNGDFVKLDPFRIILGLVQFDQLLGIIERAAGIAHKYSPRNSDNRSSDQQAANKINSEGCIPAVL